MNLKEWIDTLDIDSIQDDFALCATRLQLKKTLGTINKAIETKPLLRSYASGRKKIVANLLKQCDEKIASLQKPLI